MECAPVLLLLFNRSDVLAQVFERIREAAPKYLFIAADGPRPEREGEAELCEAARKTTEMIDWNCEVKRLYRDENLGCRKAVGSAITWFFEHVEAGIIIEDDCLVEPTFFHYCTELLEHYRHDERIACISGMNYQDGVVRGDGSYYFSILNHCWGWASWRRAWAHYDTNMSLWEKFRDGKWLYNYFDKEDAVEYWQQTFEAVYQGKINTWDYIWTYSCWLQSALAILPNRNLVSNIGYGDMATHGKVEDLQHSRMKTYPMEFPLKHPSAFLRDKAADDYTVREHLHVGTKPLKNKFKRLRRKLLNKGKNL